MDQYANGQYASQYAWCNGTLEMGLFIYLSDFLTTGCFFAKARGVSPKKSLYRSVRNATGSRIRICYRFQ